MTEHKTISEGGGKYSIDSNGNVYGKKGILKPLKMEIGYLSVALSLGNRKVVRKYIHILVAENFISRIPKDKVVNHIDGDKHNNKLENLEIIDRTKNAKEWILSGKRTNPIEGRNNKNCPFGHPYSQTKNGGKYCLECRKMTPQEKLKAQKINLDDFRSIKGASQFMVDQNGRVLNGITYRLMRPGKNLPGYLYVNIKTNTGERKNKALHRLVFENFINSIPENMIIDHIDGNKENNHVSNLRCISASENISSYQERKRKSGTFGFNHDEEFIQMIKWFLENTNFSQSELGRRMGIAQSHVSAISNKRAWSHVTSKRPPDSVIRDVKLNQFQG